MTKEYKPYPHIKLMVLVLNTADAIVAQILMQDESLRRKYNDTNEPILSESDVYKGNGLYPVQMSIKSWASPEFFSNGSVVTFYICGTDDVFDYTVCKYDMCSGRSGKKFMKTLRECVARINQNVDVGVKLLI